CSCVRVAWGVVRLLPAWPLLCAASLLLCSNGFGLLAGFLPAGDRLLRALARPRVRARALPVHREAAAVPDPLVRADLDLALDVGGDLAPQVTLDLHVRVDERPQLGDLVVGEVTNPRVGRQPGLATHDLRGGATDPEDVRQGDLESLLARDVDTGNSRHA